jgi:predicted MFS family arabinose efflux permease
VRTYRQLFAVKEFRALFIAQCLTVGGFSIGSLALGTITYAQTGSPVWTGLSLFGGPLVMFVGSMFLMSASDLMRPRQAMMLSASVWVVVEALQAVPGMPWQLRFVLLAVPFLTQSATSGTVIALVADILPEDGFVLGRSTLNIAVGVMQFVGYAVGGLLLLRLNTTQLFLTAAVLGAGGLAVRFQISDYPPRARDRVIRRTWRLNRDLLSSRMLLPVYLSSWVPNGLIVGCESLFIPFAPTRAGYLLAAGGAGMLVGDVVVGRYIPHAWRDRILEPLRLLLAAPYVVYLVDPAWQVGVVLTFVASLGYAASLPLQERLVAHTPPQTRGHVLGLRGTGMVVMQSVGALIAGGTAQALGVGPKSAAHAMGVMALASIAVTVALVPGLRLSRPVPVSAPALADAA